jgi:hypothetical protein
MIKKLVILASLLVPASLLADTGDIPLSSNFQENSGRPLDAKLVADDSTARLAMTETQVYNGMIVFQKDNSHTYQLQGSTYTWVDLGILSSSAGAVTLSPTAIGFGSPSSTMAVDTDNLNYSSTTKSLVITGTTTVYNGDSFYGYAPPLRTNSNVNASNYSQGPMFTSNDYSSPFLTSFFSYGPPDFSAPAISRFNIVNVGGDGDTYYATAALPGDVLLMADPGTSSGDLWLGSNNLAAMDISGSRVYYMNGFTLPAAYYNSPFLKTDSFGQVQKYDLFGDSPTARGQWNFNSAIVQSNTTGLANPVGASFTTTNTGNTSIATALSGNAVASGGKVQGLTGVQGTVSGAIQSTGTVYGLYGSAYATGGQNIGLYGTASSGLTNHALYLGVGDVYLSASGSAGTDGQVFTSKGAGVRPQWSTPTGGGGSLSLEIMGNNVRVTSPTITASFIAGSGVTITTASVGGTTAQITISAAGGSVVLEPTSIPFGSPSSTMAVDTANLNYSSTTNIFSATNSIISSATITALNAPNIVFPNSTLGLFGDCGSISQGTMFLGDIFQSGNCYGGGAITLVNTAGTGTLAMSGDSGIVMPTGIPVTFGDYSQQYSAAQTLDQIIATTSTWTAQQSWTNTKPSTFTALTVSGLTSGQCVQTTTGGRLSVTGSACGSGGGGSSPFSWIADVATTTGPAVSTNFYTDNVGTGNTLAGSHLSFINNPSPGAYISAYGDYSGNGCANGGCTYDTFIGYYTGAYIPNASYDVYVGDQAGAYGTGSYNVSVGHLAGYAAFGNNSVFLGNQAGQSATGSGGIFLGNKSGFYQTSDNVFMVNNVDRGDEATEQAQSLMYGKMASAPTDQFMVINASMSVTSAVFVSTPIGSGTALYRCSGGTSANLVMYGSSGAEQTICTTGGGSLLKMPIYVP